MHVHVHIVFGLAFESSGLLAAMRQTAVVALLCAPVLAVHNFRPTLLRPRAVHLRTAAPSPACIALDPDLQPVDDRDEASTGLDKLTEIPEVIVVSEEVEGSWCEVLSRKGLNPRGEGRRGVDHVGLARW